MVVKPNIAGGGARWGWLGFAIEKWSRPPTLSKLTHMIISCGVKAGRLHQLSKSGPDMIISCGNLRLLGSTRHRKVVQNPHSVQADTHDYFLRRPKAGRLHLSSKSGPDMIIFCGGLRLVGAPPVIEKWSRIPTLYTTKIEKLV